MLTTNRLNLREYTLNDAPFIYTLMNSEGWLKYIGDRKIHSVKDAENYIEKFYLTSYKTNGYGANIVELKSTNTAIGSCGIYKRETLEHPDVGFAFLSEYCKKGYALEAATAVMEDAVTNLKLPVICAITLEHNVSSINLLHKLGLSKINTVKLTPEDDELLLFSNLKH